MSVAIVPAVRARLNKQFLLGARNTAFLTEYVSGMETVKSLQMEPQLEKRFGNYLASYLEAGFRTRQLSNTYTVAANALEQLMTYSILCAGAWLVMQNAGFTVGMLVAYQMFAGRLSQPLLRLVGLWQEFQQAAIAVKRLGDVMNAPAEPYSIVPSRSSPASATLEVSDLSFRYSDQTPFLYEHLNVKVEAGACAALIGPSGSGKSTLAKLMQGFYLPAHGHIGVAGRDTRHMAANELRQYFGVVPQETRLFSGTVYENLTLANPHATFDQVVQACRMAEIHETIEGLTGGIPDHGRRARGRAFRRPAAAHRHRARAAQAAEDPHLRRSDQQPRFRHGGAVRPDDQSVEGPGHHALHRASTAQGAESRPGRRSRARQRPGGRRAPMRLERGTEAKFVYTDDGSADHLRPARTAGYRQPEVTRGYVLAESILHAAHGGLRAALPRGGRHDAVAPAILSRERASASSWSACSSRCRSCRAISSSRRNRPTER